MELLSPVGSFTAVRAAVLNGADAVYFGFGDYNARRNAKNLSEDEAREAVTFCRVRGVKTYITLNTLLTDRELSNAGKFVKLINDIGADAVLVQDAGLARLIKMVAPELKMHASTQMTVHNLEGALAAHEMGFSRVVLARELPLSEIAYISKNAPVETEVFVHGALCVCYSGQCYMSSVIGQRSGNRGLCAGPCRLQYSFFNDAPDNHLSLKDLSLSGHLRELEEAGVSCLKIEGRMKREEYTAICTSVYAKALKEKKEPDRMEIGKLITAFSRDGFTDGYLTNKKGAWMFGVRSEAPPKEEKNLFQEAKKSYSEGREIERVALNFSFVACRGKKVLLACEDQDKNNHIAEAKPAETAQNRWTTASDIEGSLRKTGGTVFYPGEINIHIDDGLMVPLSAINALRRECTEKITEKRASFKARRIGEFYPGFKRINRTEAPSYSVSVTKFDQLSLDLLRCRPEFLYLPLEEAFKHMDDIEVLLAGGINCGITFPRIIFDSEWPEVEAMLVKMKALGVSDALCGNIGQIKTAERTGFRPRGDFGLNVMNSQSLKEYKKLGLTSATLSFELNFSQIRDISKSMDTELIIYGRLPLMVTENCIIKSRTNKCSCENVNQLTDRTGKSFPIIREFKHRNVILNSHKLFLADKDEYKNVGVSFARFMFTTENQRECATVISRYLNKEAYEPSMITRGLYFRGVE
ncbi:MAG: U32 family peptidase [Bacillota bacterium]|nr:U32 family peptidase [Bacillota bacterium]